MPRPVNFGNVADDYAKFRDELPSVIFEQLNKRNVDFQGKHVLDLGSGSGIFSRAMAIQGSKVIGVEPEKKLIDQANELDGEFGSKIKYVCSTAEEMNFSDCFCDIVTALRAWHWFDRKIVNEQVMRMLKDGGFLIVIHSIFVPQLSKVAQETIRIIGEFIEDLRPAGSMGETQERRTGLPVHWFDEWQQIGFEIVDEWQHEYSLTFSKGEWCGKVRSLSWLTNADEEKKEQIIHSISEYLADYDDALNIPHRYSVVVLKK